MRNGDRAHRGRTTAEHTLADLSTGSVRSRADFRLKSVPVDRNNAARVRCALKPALVVGILENHRNRDKRMPRAVTSLRSGQKNSLQRKCLFYRNFQRVPENLVKLRFYGRLFRVLTELSINFYLEIKDS